MDYEEYEEKLAAIESLKAPTGDALAWTQRQLKTLEWLKDDAEEAHRFEDRLYRVVLSVIATSSEDARARELASLLLTSDTIEFPRWYA